MALQRLFNQPHAWDEFFNIYTPPSEPASLIEP